MHIEKIIGMSAYDNNAHLIGNVQEIGLRKLLDGKVEFSFKIKGSNNEIREIEWNKISKIGDIIILAADQSLQASENKSRGLGDGVGNVSGGNSNMNINSSSSASSSSTGKLDTKICKNCKSHNEAESIFCEECGKKLE